MSQMIKIPPAAFKPLSNALSDLPPLLLFFTCKNADQSNAYVRYQQMFVDLKQSLLCYFGGLPLPTYMDKGYQSVLRLQLSTYLRLYEVIAFGWEYLPANSYESPGDLLQEIITRESVFLFKQCQARYSSFSPKNTRTDEYFVRSLETSAKLGKKITPVQKQKVRAMVINGQSQRVSADLEDLKHQCIDTLKSMKKMPPEVRASLRAYEQAIDERGAYILAYYHPRKNRKGHQVVKGKLVETS